MSRLGALVIYPDNPRGDELHDNRLPETQVRATEDIARNRNEGNSTEKEKEMLRQWEQELKKREEELTKWEEERKKWEEKRKMQEEEVKEWEERKRREEAKGPVGLSGHFNSWEFRQWDEIRPCDWMRINFYGNKIDAILTGLNILDFDCNKDVGVKTYACQHGSSNSDEYKITLEPWLDTRMYASGCDWIALHLSRHSEVQYGSFSTIEDHPPERPQMTTVKYVAFDRKYTKEEGVPNVAIWLNAIDMEKNTGRFSFMTSVSNVTRKGFMLHVNSCNKTHLRSAGVSWVSYPKGKTGIDSVEFSSQKTLRGGDKELTFDTGRVSFSNLNRQIKHVFVALKEFGAEGCGNIRAKITTYVDKEEVHWRVDTWIDSVVHRAVGTIIVLE